MSSSIWMRCGGISNQQPLQLSPWRVVEARHRVSTRQLVDSADEQELLEALIDRVKPPARLAPSLHYLLSTPFRYPPLRHGSRFGTRMGRGIWYGAVQPRTAFAEVAYYRLLFVAGTQATLDVVTTELSAFTVRTRSASGIHLDEEPFAVHRAEISSPTSYAASQSLGRAMRADGVALFLYASARDPDTGLNVGAFTPTVFGQAKPQHVQRWHCVTTRTGVEFARGDLSARPERYAFAREAFLVAGVLPTAEV